MDVFDIIFRPGPIQFFCTLKKVTVFLGGSIESKPSRLIATLLLVILQQRVELWRVLNDIADHCDK